MKYLYLSIAIILEVVGSSFLSVSEGFSKLIPTAVAIGAYILCFFFFSLALKSIPLGIAYAMWAGLGIILTALVSVLVLKKPLDTPAIIGMAFIITGVVIINYFSKTTAH
ncbi:MAG: multidrug efflux SMR transporter [Sphingobacteriaceae bacterium]|nr:MAG: multidrug efflux SMR transporter [Sphingobacteriaceae bacterium]